MAAMADESNAANSLRRLQPTNIITGYMDLFGAMAKNPTTQKLKVGLVYLIHKTE